MVRHHWMPYAHRHIGQRLAGPEAVLIEKYVLLYEDGVSSVF